MGDDEEKEVTPGADMDEFVFEEVKGDKFVFWNKKTKQIVDRPSDAINYVPLANCPWELAEQTEDYQSKEKLWHEIKTFLIDHVFLPDERLYDILTGWVLATWVSEEWNVIPYLLIKGPMSSGKTRLLETLEAITYRGIFSANMTSSALFRLLELYRLTIFLDETEIYNKEEYSDVTHLLNAGYRRGQKAWRVETDKDGLRFVKGYDVFGFKAMAGTEELAATLNSRSITIDMVKNIQRVNFSVNKKRALALRNRLLLWRFYELSTCKPYGDEGDDSDDSDGVYPLLSELKDGRLMELFYCLVKLANEGKENMLSYARDMLGEREDEEQASLQYQCLEAMLQCKNDVTEGKILVKTIKDKMNEQLNQKEQFTSRFITRLLSGLGFKKCHMKRGVGIVWSEKMFGYRVRQYRLGGYTLPVSSLSSPSSPTQKTEPVITPDLTDNTVFASACWACQKSILKNDDYTFYGGKPIHTQCMKDLQLKERSEE